MIYKPYESPGLNLFRLIQAVGNNPSTDSQQTIESNLCKALYNLDRKIDTNASNIQITQDLDFNNFSIENLKGLGFKNGEEITWNADDYTINVPTGLGPVNQVGQELFVIVYNANAFQIDNGSVVYPNGAFNTRPTIGKAIANTHETIAEKVLLATMDIPAGSYGICTENGQVRDVDTDSWNLGDTLYVSSSTAGELTNVRPEFPNYAIQIGGVSKKDALTGIIQVGIKGEPQDTVINFWNGTMREAFDFRISSDGATITGSLEPANGHPDLTMIFSDGFTMLDASPSSTVALIAGTDAIPQTNYVYIPVSTKALTVSGSDWPNGTSEHIKIAQIELQSAASVKSRGALRNQNINDEIENTSTYQGHLSHIGERLRQESSKWDSGAEGSVVVAGGGSDVYVKNTAGVVYQMHKQGFPILDMTPYSIDAVNQGNKTFTISDDGDLTSVFPDERLIQVKGSTGNDGIYTVASTAYSAPDFVITVEEAISDATADGEIGDDIAVVNDFTSPYDHVDSLTEITTDASGDPLNNTSFSVVVWGTANKSGEPCHLMANYPVSTYNKNFPEQAVADALNHSVYSIPKKFQGVGFLIARFTFVDNGGLWSLYDTEDLRGSIPNSTAGGGAGGAGVTTLLGLTDTPSSYTGHKYKLLSVNEAETAEEFSESGAVKAINAQTGTSYTLVLGDAGKIVQMNNAAANVITIPLNASVAFPSGATWGAALDVVQIGAGLTTVRGASGVTLNGNTEAGGGESDVDSAGQYKGLSLYKNGTNSWVVLGRA